MRKTYLSTALAFAVTALPLLAAAQTLNTAQTGIFRILGIVAAFMNGLIGVAITLAIVVFFWGLIKYLLGSGSEGKADGLKVMFYGVVTIFVMVSVWGLVNLLQSTFLGGTGASVAPNVNTLRIQPTF